MTEEHMISLELDDLIEGGFKLGKFRHFRKQCYRHLPCMLKIEVTNKEGNLEIGTGFHIGDGYVVTAGHVAKLEALRVLAHPFIGSQSRFGDEAFFENEESAENNTLEVSEIIYPDDTSIDLAVLKTDFNSEFYMSDDLDNERKKVDHFRLREIWDEYFWNEEVLTTEVLLLGYPRIPLSNKTFLVTAKADINSVIGRMSSVHTYLVLSSMARGGFSGAPVIDSKGRVLAICIESLNEHEIVEAGYTAAISVEALNRTLALKKIFPGRNAKLIKRIETDLPFVTSKRAVGKHFQSIV